MNRAASFPEHIEAARRQSAKARVLAALQAKPCTNLELADICQRFGGRIHELRTEWLIDKEQIDFGIYRYTLRGKLPQAPLLRLMVG